MTQRVITDSILGALTWDKRRQTLSGQIQLSRGREIELSIDAQDLDIIVNDELAVAPFLAKARFQIATVIQREKEFRLAIADQVIQHYCKEFHIGPVNRSEIAENIGLYAIGLYEEGLTLYYQVSKELGWWKEHDITLVVDAHGEVEDVFWL